MKKYKRPHKRTKKGLIQDELDSNKAFIAF